MKHRYDVDEAYKIFRQNLLITGDFLPSAYEENPKHFYPACTFNSVMIKQACLELAEI